MDNSVSIVLVSDTVFDSNGVSRFIQDMAFHSASASVPFKVITASPLRRCGTEGNIINRPTFWAVSMPYYKEQYLNLIPPVWGIVKTIRSIKPDVIHISTPGPLGVTAMLTAKCMGIAVAGTYHTDFPAYLGKITKSRLAVAVTACFMRLFYHRMSLVFSRSEAFMKVLHDDLRLDADKTALLAPGTDLEHFNPRYRDRTVWVDYGLEPTTLKLLYVGRLNIEKNFLFVVRLFRAFKVLYAGEIDLVVLGEGEYLADRDRYRDEGIHMLGVRYGEELSTIYASSDIFVFASVTETLGQVVMEAQASGLPCIVADEGGVTDTVEDGVTGYTCPIEDEEAWLSALVKFSKNPELRREMGEAGHARMQGRSIQRSFDTFFQRHAQLRVK